MSSLKNAEFIELLTYVLPEINLSCAYQGRSLILARINELKENIINERVKLREEIAARAERLGITIDDLVPPAKAQRAKSAPKYKNPDTGEIWSGKGRRPNWVNAIVESGKEAD